MVVYIEFYLCSLMLFYDISCRYFSSCLFFISRRVYLVITYFASDTNHETKREDWNQPENRSPSKNPNQTASLLPSKLPARAHLPSCAGTHDFAQNFCLVIYLHLMFLMAFISLNIFFCSKWWIWSSKTRHPWCWLQSSQYQGRSIQ